MNAQLTFPADRLTHAREIISFWEHLLIPHDEAIAEAFAIREQFSIADAYRNAANLVESEVCHTSSCYLYEGPFTKPYDHRTCVTLRELVKELRALAKAT